jgi:hypothetical protein
MLESFNTLLVASQLVACHLPHGGLAEKILSHVKHESQVVDPGREYCGAGQLWQCVALEVLV